MPRRERPAQTTRSEHWLRVAVNEATDDLNAQLIQAFGWSPVETIRWLSPLRDDDFAEYYDQAFLDRVGLFDLAVPLAEFWPNGGPRWDGLARTEGGKVILVEAKAYIEEMVDYESNAGPKSRARILDSLSKAKYASGAAEKARWDAPFYQMGNRLAHLHFLLNLNQIAAYLAFLAFADAPDVPQPCTVEQWEGAHRLSRKCLGLGAHPFQGRVANIIWSVRDLLANKALRRAPM